MAKTILSTTQSDVVTGATAAGATEFWFLGYATSEKNATETNRHITYRTAGTVSKLYVRVTANTTSANSTVTVRKNGADTALTLTITAGTSAVFENTTDSVTVAAGDELCYKTVSGGTGTFTFSVMSVIFDATTDCAVRLVSKGYGVATASVTHYLPIAGDRSGTTATEANTENTLKETCTLKNACINVTANARTTNTTFTLRKNRANTAIAITYTSTETGMKEDTANSISYAADDELDWAITTGTGTQTLTFQCAAIDIVTTTNRGILTTGVVGATADIVQTEPTTWYYAIGGGMLQAVTTEANAQQKAREAFTFKNLIVYVGANTITGTSTFSLRVNGADAISQSITSSQTGFIANTTNTTTVAAGDLICYAMVTPAVTGTPSMTIRQMSITTELASLTRISKSNTLIYHIQGRISKSTTLRYAIIGRISKSVTLRYNILERIAKSITLRYAIIGRISKSATIRYAIIGRISKASTLRYNILGRISKTTTLRYDIRALVSKSTTLRYNIVGRVSKPITLVYNIVGRVSKATTLRYNILGRVSKPFTLRYDILGRISKPTTLRYNIIGRISKPVSLRYNIIGRVSKEVTLKYHIVGRVSKSTTLIYHILAEGLTRISKDVTLRYNIVGRVSKPTTLRYDILGRISKTTTLRYHILGRVSKSTTLRYNIFSRVSKSVSLIYHIAGRVSKPITLRYNILSEIVEPPPAPPAPTPVIAPGPGRVRRVIIGKREFDLSQPQRRFAIKRTALGRTQTQLTTSRFYLLNGASRIPISLSGPLQLRPDQFKTIEKRTRLPSSSHMVLSCKRLTIALSSRLTVASSAVLVANASVVTLQVGNKEVQKANTLHMHRLIRLERLKHLKTMLDFSSYFE